MFRRLFLALVLLALPLSSQAAEPPTSSPIPTGALARPTKAGIRFCEVFRAECEVNLGEPEVLRLTPAIWDRIVRIDREVNRAIKPLTDMKHFGVTDVWSYPDDGYGDCEDYQLEKRRRLVAAGLPKRPFRLAVVIDAAGTGHMVMIARTDRGDFILDNQSATIMPWRETGYEFIKRESDDPANWLQLIPGNPTASNRAGIPRTDH